MDIKPRTVKWEVSNFSPGRTFDTVRCIKGRLGAFHQKTSIGGVWSQAEQALDINILELREAKFALLTFCRYKKDLAVHVQMDNQAALVSLIKMGGTRDLLMIQEAKKIWETCFMPIRSHLQQNTCREL